MRCGRCKTCLFRDKTVVFGERQPDPSLNLRTRTVWRRLIRHFPRSDDAPLPSNVTGHELFPLQAKRGAKRHRSHRDLKRKDSIATAVTLSTVQPAWDTTLATTTAQCGRKSRDRDHRLTHILLESFEQEEAEDHGVGERPRPTARQKELLFFQQRTPEDGSVKAVPGLAAIAELKA